MQDLGIGAGLGAIGFWAFVAVIIVAGIWDSQKKRDAKLETVRRLLEHQRDVDPALIERLLSMHGSDKPAARDLMVGGIVALSAAPGLAGLGWALSFVASAAMYPLLGVAALAGCVGIGLLVAARQVHRHALSHR
jgi:hypothetical protein